MVPKDGMGGTYGVGYLASMLLLFACLRIPRNHFLLLHEMRWGYVSWHVFDLLKIV